MEIPEVIVKQEISDEFNFTTEPNVNYETQNSDLVEIKQEPVKLEACSDLFISTNLDHQLKLLEKTKTIENDYNSVSNYWLNEGQSQQLEGNDEMENKKMDDLADVQWQIENNELNIKEEENVTDEDCRNSPKLVLDKQHEEDAASTKKEEISRKNLRCDQCEYKTGYPHKFELHVNKHKLDKIIKFKCNLCDLETYYAGSLKRHILIKHKNQDESNKYQCDQCDYQTVDKRNLKHHFSKHSKPVKDITSTQIKTVNKTSKEIGSEKAKKSRIHQPLTIHDHIIETYITKLNKNSKTESKEVVKKLKKRFIDLFHIDTKPVFLSRNRLYISMVDMDDPQNNDSPTEPTEVLNYHSYASKKHKVY